MHFRLGLFLMVLGSETLWAQAASQSANAAIAVADSSNLASLPEYYRPMAFLVGACWVGTFPDGKATDEKCFEWMFDRKFIRERHVVKGAKKPYSGETIFAWDPGQKQVVFTYLNSLGGLSTGKAEFEAEGIVFPETHVTAKGTLEMKAIWKRLGPDSYQYVQWQKEGDQWKTLWSIDFRRASTIEK